MKILVTGGAGFIGSHLVESFQGEADIVVLDNLSTGDLNNLAGLEYQFIQGDICDPDVLNKAMTGVDYVFHLAAMVSVVESMDFPERCLKTNSMGTLEVLRAAGKARVKKMILSSTCAIYGDAGTEPSAESSMPRPSSTYALCKLDGEFLLRQFGPLWGVEVGMMRYFNVFGPRQSPQSVYAAAIPIFITRALAGQDITIFGDGQQTRDFVYVKDVVAANRLLMTCGDSQVYNVAGGSSMTVLELAEKIVAATNSSSNIKFADPRPGEVLHSSAVIERITDLGFKHGQSLDEALSETVASFLA